MYKPGDVFQPKAFPKLTYIGRSIDEDSTYEEELQEALDDTGTLVVIMGASKSDKTVLCHKVVERERYISLSGSQYIARTIKTELFNGLKAIILTLPHRSDDIICMNPDLIGRTTLIDMP